MIIEQVYGIKDVYRKYVLLKVTSLCFSLFFFFLATVCLHIIVITNFSYSVSIFIYIFVSRHFTDPPSFLREE